MKTFYHLGNKTIYIIQVDERITPDDDFRRWFYDFHTLKDMAKHILHNISNGFRFVEGIGEAGDYDPETKTGGYRVIIIEVDEKL